MGLTLHHLECLLILIALSVNWTCSNHHLMCLVMLLTLQVMLVMELLIMLVHHHFHLVLLIGRVFFIIYLLLFFVGVHVMMIILTAKHEVWLDSKILFFFRNHLCLRKVVDIKWVYISSRLYVKIFIFLFHTRCLSAAFSFFCYAALLPVVIICSIEHVATYFERSTGPREIEHFVTKW